jgi:hypothetical protein
MIVAVRETFYQQLTFLNVKKISSSYFTTISIHNRTLLFHFHETSLFGVGRDMFESYIAIGLVM